MSKENKDKPLQRQEKFLFFPLLWMIIRKNLKLIQRSKSSSLIVLLGPLIIIALVGSAYNTSNIYDIRVGAYSEEYSELANTVLDSLGGQQFSLIKFETKEECLESLKVSETHVCIIIPPRLQIGDEEALDFHVDQSRVNIVWIVIDALSSKLESTSSEISLQLTSALLGTLRQSHDTIESTRSEFDVLNKKNQEVVDALSGVSGSITTANFNILEAVDLGKISQKLDSVIDQNNLSSAPFDPVFATISNVKNKTEHLEESLQNITSGAVQGLEGVQSTLAVSTDTLSSLNTNLDTLQTTISSVTGQRAETVVNPLRTHITPVVVEKTHLSFLFPTLIVLVVMLISLLLSSSLIIREKTSPAFFRNFITPVNDSIFLLGHFFTNLLVLFLQLGIIFAVSSFFFKGRLVPVLGMVFFSLLLIVSLFILIGMLVGYLFKSEETSLLATISLASLFLFFSSTILPLETLPESLKRVANFNPFVISEGILKKIMLFQSSFDVISQALSILFVYILFISLALYGIQKFIKTRVE